MSNLRELEKVVLKYLESRPSDWSWVLSDRVLNKNETIRLFKKDKKFRKMMMEQIIRFATDQFLKAISK